jgi:hypothetical protein
MTDDFQLFQDSGGADAIDADIALITAYLARELSPVQIVAVEDRLTNDPAFRKKVNPILQAWVLPTALAAVHAGQGPLSRDEVETGWTRYVGEHAELDAHEGPRLVVEGAQRKRRKISMTRIAAGIAAITLPVFALAQVVVYVSKHEDAPGHTVAKQMVAPFVEPPPAVAPPVQVKKAPPTPVDVPVGRQLEKGRAAVQRTAPVAVPVVETPRPTPAASVSAGNPDRLKIAAIANKHFPEVVRGDTAANYAVIVLNASDDYVWSTYGVGSVQLVIGGDKRTPGERSEFNRANALELVGAARAAGGGGGVGGSAGGASFRRDTAVAVAAYGGRGRGAADTTVALNFDSSQLRSRDTLRNVLARVDTALAGRVGGGGGAGAGVARGGGGAVASARVGGVGGSAGGGRGGAFSIDSGSYYFGAATRTADGQSPLNAAPGLQEAGKGESGIQGLKASDLTQGDMYLFAPGQLAPQLLRILVVYLAPGVNWKGR